MNRIIRLLTVAFIALFLLGGISLPLQAQAPWIGGIGMYDGSTPMHDWYYWSIYGTNLSTGFSTAHFTVLLFTGDTYAYDYLHFNLINAHGQNQYWYESASQINFGAHSYDHPPYYRYGAGGVTVCDEYTDLCSNESVVHYIPWQY